MTDYSALAKKFSGTTAATVPVVSPSQPVAPAAQPIAPMTPTVKPAVNYAQLAAKHKGTIVAPEPNEATMVDERSFAEKAGDFLGITKLGKGLGQAFAQPKLNKVLQEDLTQSIELEGKLLARIKEVKAAGGNTEALEKSLKIQRDYINSLGDHAEEFLNPEGLTNKEVIGSAISLASLALGNPMAAGAGMGAGNALQEDGDLGDVALQATIGAVAGKILQFGFNKAAPYVQRGIQRFGVPFFEKISGIIPEGARATYKSLAQGANKAVEQGTKAINENAVGRAVNEAGEVVTSAFNKGKSSLRSIVPEKAPETPNVPTAKTEAPKPAAFEVPEDPKFNGLRTSISERNVNPQVQTSFERLAGRGEDVAKKYEGFFDQEVRYAKNAKEDTAIAKVGENIGNAFESVAKMRREMGSRMGNEIKRFGNEKIDISDTFKNFEQKLLDEANIVVDGKKIRSTTQQSALTRQDRGQLETYINDLNKLGPNPTAGNLDAFIRRVTRELELFKSKNNIMGTTNTERLIKNSLNELRDSFSPAKNPNFETYYNSKKIYSDLSDFLEEGQGFLGKKTQAGDYAKDASIAKSSVQSVLNNGKKDWLIRLEDLTGYTAIDDAAVALQAMKDAGNVQGRSLLELFSPEAKSAVPTSRGEVVKRVIDAAVSGGKRALVGSPKEQTIRVIKAKTPKIDSFSKGKYRALTEDLIKSGQESKTYIDDLADAAVSGEASVLKTPVKSLDSIFNKVRRDFGNYASGIYNVKDVARNTIISEPQAQTSIVKKLKGDKSYTRHKIQDPLDYYGYRGQIINFETPNGLHAEIQVVSPEMIVAKMPPEDAIKTLGKERFDAIVKKSGQRPGLGHEYYDKIKEAREKGDTELAKSLIEQSENYYSHF